MAKKEPFRLTPRLYGWSLWWNGWAQFGFGYQPFSQSFGLGPFSLEKGYTA